jgi:hypothetical protein
MEYAVQDRAKRYWRFTAQVVDSIKVSTWSGHGPPFLLWRPSDDGPRCKPNRRAGPSSETNRCKLVADQPNAKSELARQPSGSAGLRTSCLRPDERPRPKIAAVGAPNAALFPEIVGLFENRI